MKTDRELLEMAAKAAGVEVVRHVASLDGKQWCVLKDEKQSFWNPLTDDGDALRLAVALEIDVTFRVVGEMRVEALAPSGPRIVEGYDSFDGRLPATRRAIVRAAADIGRSM